MTLLHHRALSPWVGFGRPSGCVVPQPRWVPSFDILETDSEYVLRGDVPGIAQEDIEIRVEEGLLSVRGERSRPESDERLRNGGRAFGKFLRRFWLPDSVETDGARASYVDGVLEISLPKRDPEENSRLVPVN